MRSWLGARNVIESRIIAGLETLGGFGGVADRLNSYNLISAHRIFLAADIGRYENASIESSKPSRRASSTRISVWLSMVFQASRLARKFRLRKRSRRTPLKMAGSL